jgi:hypothetical protein
LAGGWVKVFLVCGRKINPYLDSQRSIHACVGQMTSDIN